MPNGIGRHQETLSSDQLKSLQKAVYAANILLVLVSSCAQTSILVFLYEITPRLLHKRLIYIVAGFITLFFIPSFLVTVFPCRPPNVWEVLGSQCIDQPFFWKTFAGVNLVVESVLILLPAFMVWPLIMERRRKSIVITGFAARLAYVFPNVLGETCQAADMKKGHGCFRCTVL